MTHVSAPLLLLTALQLKHFAFDFPLQTPYQYRNKGTYGHPGGLLHAGLHAAATATLLVALGYPAVLVSVVETLVHYHVDWAKMNINRRMGWRCDSGDWFWTLLGFDQLLHQLTYLWIVWMLMQ